MPWSLARVRTDASRRGEDAASGRDRHVMNPMPKGRDLSLARNDKAETFGCMTSARQNLLRDPAANAASAADRDDFTRQRSVPAGAPRTIGWEGAMCKPLSLADQGA